MTSGAASPLHDETPGNSGELAANLQKEIEKPNIEEMAVNSIQEDLDIAKQRALLGDKKLALLINLDNVLIDSVEVGDVKVEDFSGVKDVYNINGTLTKLRPFVHTFLKKANDMYEMCMYTTADGKYTDQITKLIDPQGVYFPSRVICPDDNSQDQKGVNVEMGPENMVIILDHSDDKWDENKKNIIFMKRYRYFRSLTDFNRDEDESKGFLASMLRTLRMIHHTYYNPDSGIELTVRDVREILPNLKKEVLRNCNIWFCAEQPVLTNTVLMKIRKLAEEMGAICSPDSIDSATHFVGRSTTITAKMARDSGRFLVSPSWILAAHYLWKRPKEEHFVVEGE